MRLSTLLDGILSINIDRDYEINSICFDSRRVTNGALFVAIPGVLDDGTKYINEAIERGAVAVICPKDVNMVTAVQLIKVDNPRKTLSLLAKKFYDNASDSLNIIGITGTKGKTTTAFMIYHMLKECGVNVAFIGTLGAFLPKGHTELSNTTPDPITLHRLFKQMVRDKVTHVVMEISSIALKQDRVFGINFSTTAFLNLFPDHIGTREHKDFDEYKECKKLLFNSNQKIFANKDDENTDFMLEGIELKSINYFSKDDILSIKSQKEQNKLYTCFSTIIDDNKLDIKITELGIPNALNAVLALKIISPIVDDIKKAIKALENCSIKGRYEIVEEIKNFTLMIDYAHNKDSMETLLHSLKEFEHNNLIVLFGAGGGRDHHRRFEVGEIAGKLADLCIITEDNSRDENPLDIMSEIEKGVKNVDGNYVLIEDRKKAIKHALEVAKDDDIVVLAGKGHETTIEKNGKIEEFDERKIVLSFLEKVD